MTPLHVTFLICLPSPRDFKDTQIKLILSGWHPRDKEAPREMMVSALRITRGRLERSRAAVRKETPEEPPQPPGPRNRRELGHLSPLLREAVCSGRMKGFGLHGDRADAPAGTDIWPFFAQEEAPWSCSSRVTRPSGGLLSWGPFLPPFQPGLTQHLPPRKDPEGN